MNALRNPYPLKHAWALILVGLGLLLPISSVESAEEGFGGELTFGAIHLSERPSQLDVGDGNEVVSSLDHQAGYERYNEPYLAGEVHYTLADLGTTLFIDALNDTAEAELSAGVRQRMGRAGQLSVAVSYGQVAVWEDPYLTGVKRKETHEELLGLTLGYDEIFGTGAFISTTTQVVDVKEDKIGDREKKLRRDGVRNAVSVGYRLPLSASSELTPTLRAESRNMRGEANSSDGIGASLTYGWQQGHWLFETTAGMGYDHYREEHPVFDKTRQAFSYGGFALIGYTAPFGLTPVTLYALASYRRCDENIDFFDSEGWETGAGIGVEF